MPPDYEGADGLMPLFVDQGGRALVDLPSKSFWVVRRDADETLSRVLSGVLRLPVRVAGTSLVIADIAARPAFAPLAPFVGRPVVQVGERKVEDLLAGLRGPNRLQAMIGLVKAVSGPYRALVRNADGNTVPINVELPDQG